LRIKRDVDLKVIRRPWIQQCHRLSCHFHSSLSLSLSLSLSIRLCVSLGVPVSLDVCLCRGFRRWHSM